MGLPGVSVGSLGAGGGGGGGGGGVTPGAGSSGFTEFRVIVADAVGALNEGPSENYDFIGDAGGVLNLRLNVEAGGPGSYAWMRPLTPLTVGAAGYSIELSAGDGAAADAAVAGGAGAGAYLYGGTGGAGSAARVAGVGGNVSILAGAPGANGGAGGANGGSVLIDASDGTGAGVTGSVLIGTQTVSLIGTRYVQVGPAAGSVPLLVDVAAPTAAELFNVAADTNALALVGRTAVGSWVATDEVNIAHFDFRASATGYALRTAASGATLLNAPGPAGANLLCYLLLGGSLANGWVIGDGAGVAHLRPLAPASFDVGTTALKVRDLHLSRDAYVGDDIELLTATDHDIYVPDSASTAGSINMRAASTTTSGNGGSLSFTAGDADTTGPGIPFTGGHIVCVAGDGAGDGGTGGNVDLFPGAGNDSNGAVRIGQNAGDLISMHGATPQSQPAAIANADGTLADITTKFNTLLGYLRARGDIAT